KTLYKISVDDVLFLKAEIDYVNVATEEKSILILDSLRNWIEKLKGFRFIQVHRSYIINIDKITKVYGNQVFIGKKVIPIGKTYKEAFLKRIN
ncbi:MAG: two-component system response regulator LytT, partial [Dokdonia sp.]